MNRSKSTAQRADGQFPVKRPNCGVSFLMEQGRRLAAARASPHPTSLRRRSRLRSPLPSLENLSTARRFWKVVDQGQPIRVLEITTSSIQSVLAVSV